MSHHFSTTAKVLRRVGEPHEHRGDITALDEELLDGYRHSDLDECLRVCKELMARGHWKRVRAFAEKVTNIPKPDCPLCHGGGVSQKVDAVYPERSPLNPRPAPCFCLGEGVNPEQARWGSNILRLVGPECWGEKTCTADFSNRPKSEVKAHQLTYCYIQNGCRACPAYKQVPDVLPDYLFFLGKAVRDWPIWLALQWGKWGNKMPLEPTRLGYDVPGESNASVTIRFEPDELTYDIVYRQGDPAERVCPPLPFVPKNAQASVDQFLKPIEVDP